MLGGMAGAKITYDSGSAWMEKLENIYERPLPAFSESYSPYALTIRLIHRHAKAFEYDCILGADAMMDPITTFSMMRGVDNLCIDLIDQPEVVQKWLENLSEMRLKIAKGYCDAREQYGRREDFNWTGVWAPGEVDALECDFSTMLSPEMFNTFVLPEVEKEAEFYDYALWHLDGTAEIRHLDSICSVSKISAIQWASDKNESLLTFMDLFKRIRKMKKSLLLMSSCIDEAVEVSRELGKDGLAFHIADIHNEKDMDIALRRLEAV
jgi:hypothetical protein